MRFFRRSLIALGVAATLPTIVFVAVGAFYFLRTERVQVEAAALSRSATVVNLSDAALRGDLRALNVLSTSVYFDTLNWREFQPRVQRVVEANQHWRSIQLFDLDARMELFDTSQPFEAPKRSTLIGTEPIEKLRAATDAVVGGVTMDGGPVIHLYLPVTHGDRHYVLTVELEALGFQELLLSQVDADSGVAAIVDRHGNFVARSRDYSRRVGTPATIFVRDAIRASDQGFYRGTTYEGLQNYTAFRTSGWSGLSAHLAVASSLIDRPRSWSFVVAGVAGLGGVILAALLSVLVLRDMAERRRAEEALRQSQKMEAVGQLTGGIAHDFNNLLTAVIGNLDMIRSRCTDNERLKRLADNALEAARRGAKLTSQLLAFSRSQRMQLTTVDLDALLNGMNALLSQSVGPAIGVRIEISSEARFVISDANQLELALLNLAVNARDAMPAGGDLTISTHAAADLDLRDLPRRSYVEIRVTDTGTGMTEAVRARAVEPFFTTKEVGHGTGLGLSQVYGIVRESGGTLFIESDVGQGTCVRLVLPLASDPAVSTPAVRAGTHTPTVPAAQGTEDVAIMVVDDDRHVRRFIGDSLRNLGYRISEAADGAEALAKLRTARIDLLVIDFAMPGMNGAEVARKAQLQQPDLRVLMVSGYADSAAIEGALGKTRLLRKPFAAGELGSAVAEVLAG